MLFTNGDVMKYVATASLLVLISAVSCWDATWLRR